MINNKKDIKLIGIDMDGTLLDNDLKISHRAKDAIKKAQAMGVHVTLCTGRMYASALPYAEEVGLKLPLITYNGAYVKDPGTGKVLYEKHLPLAYAKEAFHMAKARHIHVNVYYNDQLYVEGHSEEGRNYAQTVRVPLNLVDNMLEYMTSDPLKMVMIGDGEKIDELCQACQERFGDNISAAKSWATFLEISHKDATKGKGLEAVAQYYGLTREEVMGIGDNYNDLEMFNYAGTAVVMDNAEADLKLLADYVTSSNEDDGVAEAIEKLVLK
jgi:Cof subfamily protein (haloacid dehalogenase superfamily)